MINTNENEEIIFEPIDGIIKQSDFTDEKRNSIKSITSNSAKKIDDGACLNFKNLENVYFPNVKIVGSNAFSGCEKLVNINLPSVTEMNVKSIEYCENLSRIDIPNIDIITGNDTIFQYCEKLVEVHTNSDEQCKKIYKQLPCYHINLIRDNIFRLYSNEKIFYPKESSSEITIDPEDKIISKNKISDEVELITKISSNSATKIESDTFSSYIYLESIDFRNVDTIGDYTFYHCDNLNKVNLPRIENIGEYAFSYCKNLKNISIPEVKIIKECTFSNCENLETVDVSHAESIDKYAFSYCKNLENINLPEATSVNLCAFIGCQKLYRIDIPKIKDINNKFENYIFESLPNLTEIHTTTKKQCIKIYKACDITTKRKIEDEKIKLYYEEKIYNPIKEFKTSTNSLNTYLENLKTDYNNITENNCPICLKPLKNKSENDFVCTMYCNHQIHKNCLSYLLEKGINNCPLCKEYLRTTENIIDNIDSLDI